MHQIIKCLIVVLSLAQLGQCQWRITKQWVQQAGYNSQSTYFNYLYSNVGGVDEDSFEGLVGLKNIELSYNLIRTLGLCDSI